MPTLRDFLMPDLGEGLTEGEINRWLVAEGDVVVVDQPIAEITDREGDRRSAQLHLRDALRRSTALRGQPSPSASR